MMKQYFDTIVSGIEAKIAADPMEKTPRKLYALEISRLGHRLYSGEGVAWCGIVAPFDLLSAMGVTSCFVEFIGAMLASTGIAGEFLEEAEHIGFTSDICGYHRSIMGAANKGAMPEPDCLIATTTPCSGGVAVMENLARHFKKKLFVLNIPRQMSKSSVAYLAGQIRQMAGFVAAHTGKPLDEERLKEAVIKTNEARAVLEEVYELASSVPSPVNSRMLANFGIVITLLLGTDAAVTVTKAFRDDFAQKVATKTGGVPNEKTRLLWIQNRIQFKNPLVDMLEKQFGAVVVIDELNSITWDAIDPDDPYTGMAERAISIPFNGDGSRRIENLKKLAKKYKVDGAINPCNWGCRQGSGARGLISEGLKEIGVPVLNLEVDCVDTRSFSEGQLRTRIEAFVEMLG
ncbi:MAG: 2-hydroxyacyl-CoA dehydratase [Deltaproteobacteria bacterium]|nr:2-hydroxyacyl-CoA dehydratase [Deltaproteobacteria bacterium]